MLLFKLCFSISSLDAITCKILLLTFVLLRTAAKVLFILLCDYFLFIFLLAFVYHTKMAICSGKWCLTTMQVYFRLAFFLMSGYWAEHRCRDVKYDEK